MDVPPVWGGELVWTRENRPHRRVGFAMEAQKMSENGSEQSDFLGAFRSTRLLGQLLFVSVWFSLPSTALCRELPWRQVFKEDSVWSLTPLAVLVLILKPWREPVLLHRKRGGRGRSSNVIPGSSLLVLVVAVLDSVGWKGTKCLCLVGL